MKKLNNFIKQKKMKFNNKLKILSKWKQDKRDYWSKNLSVQKMKNSNSFRNLKKLNKQNRILLINCKVSRQYNSIKQAK